MLDGKYMMFYNVASFLASVIVNVHNAKGNLITPAEINPYNKRNEEVEDGISGIDFLAAHAAEMGIKVVQEARKT